MRVLESYTFEYRIGGRVVVQRKVVVERTRSQGTGGCTCKEEM